MSSVRNGGFEVEWAHQDSLSKEELQALIEREGEEVLCTFTREFAGRETLTPDKKLKDHEKWGLSDKAAIMARQESQVKYGQVLKFPLKENND